MSYLHKLSDKLGWCLLHNWSNYIHYEYDSDIAVSYLGTLSCAGLLNYIPSLQIRTCRRCGKEDRHDFRIGDKKYRPELRIPQPEFRIVPTLNNGGD